MFVPANKFSMQRPMTRRTTKCKLDCPLTLQPWNAATLECWRARFMPRLQQGGPWVLHCSFRQGLSFVIACCNFEKITFFCSRNCCLCAVHQSVKELRRAKEQRETRQHQKKPKTSKKAKTKQPNHTQNPHKTKQKHQKHHNHARPFAASETGETGETRSAQDR